MNYQFSYYKDEDFCELEPLAEIPQYHWELEVFISWDPRSADKDYAKEV